MSNSSSSSADGARDQMPAHHLSKPVHFVRWAKDEQQRAFYAWLPQELHDAPGVDWTLLPDIVMGYCLQSIGSAPDASHLALAAISACGTISANSLFQLLEHLHAFFTTLRRVCGMNGVSDLEGIPLWRDFADKTQATKSRSMQLSAYSSISSKHYPKYVAQLEEAGSAYLKRRYQFPLMPQDFLKQVGKASELNNGSQMRQQPVHERLSPLFPLLRELVWLRKHLAERVLQAYRQAQRQVVNGGAPLPFAFRHFDRLPWLYQQGKTWEIRQRDLSLPFVLWNKQSWILQHQDRYSQAVIQRADKASGSYSPQRDHCFVQFDGAFQDLLWFGDLIEQRLIQQFQGGQQRDPAYLERRQIAHGLGFPQGCFTSQSGLLQADAHWFAQHTQPGELLFDLEAVYRGILYGAALASVALTTGGSISEVLQVSADRWHGTPGGREQRLLPRGAKTEHERRAYKLSTEAVQLLEEIGRGLEEVSGQIPVRPATRQIANSERLPSERYYFQWQRGMICPRDTEVLVRFLLHGVNLSTPEGIPIEFSMERLRYGGNVSAQERERILMQELGVEQSALPHLSPSTAQRYARDFFAYWQFAGSKEAALQPLTLARWMVHLGRMNYQRSAIDRMLSAVKCIVKAAAAPERGAIDQRIVDAFGRIEVPAGGSSPATERAEALTRVTFTQVYKRCGRQGCSICRDGKEHGPYWYAHWRQENGTRHSIYIGREKNERTVAQALEKIEQRRGVPRVQRAHQAQPDELVPLIPTLIQLVWRRKLLAERILAEIRTVQQQVPAQAALPLHFQHADTVPELRVDLQADTPHASIVERVVILSFSLWNKRSWVLNHQDRFGASTIGLALSGSAAYSDERNFHFVQFHAPPTGALWFSDLLEHTLLRMLEPHLARDEESIRLCQSGSDLGFPRGCHCVRKGLLDTGDRWFAENARAGEMIFEPEALYRGVLYGAALAILAMSGGLGVSELLQVSADRWQVRETNPNLGGNGAYQQSLLPIKAGTREERRLYRVCPEAVVLLIEIERGLIQAHGEVPVVQPFQWIRHSSLLQPERYLFQWGALPTGEKGIILPPDLAVLVRFMLHGIRTPTGDRIIMATEALQESAPLPTLQHERALKVLKDALLAPLTGRLSDRSRVAYERHLLAYLRFADTPEQAYLPETLTRWIADLSGKAFSREKLDQMATPVRRCMAEAGRLGNLDQARAEAFDRVRVAPGKKRGPKPLIMVP